MKTVRYQFLAILAVFTFGFLSHDLFPGTENGDDVYYQDTAPLLQCTINLDCDNYYEWSMLLTKEEVPKYLRPFEYSEDLKYHSLRF